MIHLRQVSLASDLLLDDALAQVKAVPNLLVLSLNGHFTNHGLKSLSDLSEIRRLSLSGHFDDAGLIHLAKLVSLETLALRSDRLSGHGLAHLSKLPHLKNLIVRGLRPGWTFAPLKDLPALEVLNLGDDGLTDELLATLPSTDRIRSLSLQGADKVTDEGLKHLLRLPKLEELNLLQTGMSPQGLRTISSLEEIRKLLPDTNPTTSDDLEQGLEYLTRLPKLEELDLRYMGLSGVNVNMLNIPTLRKLNFDSDRHREELSQLLRQIPQLDPVTTQRITTQAELVGDSSFWQYDFLSNRLVVEADDKKGYCKASGAQASRLKTLTERLQPIAQKQGGGYSIDSEYCELTDNDLVDVVKIPWIRTVYDNGFGPAAWSQFGKLTELESLRSENDNLTNDDLNCLENLHNLEVLSLHARVTRSETGTQPVRRASFSAAALEPLQRMSHLRELQLRGDGVSDDVLTFVGRVPHLISLTLDGRITNNGLKSLSGLKSLQRLSLEGDFDDAGLVHLADLKNLESLVLKSDHVTGTGLAHLSSLPKLRLFKLRALKTGDSLAALKDWPALEALNLADEGTTDEILRTLPESDRIKSVSLLCSSVTDQGLASLQRLGGLEELNLQLTHVTDKGLEIVAGCQKLRVLCLGRAIQDHGITEKGLRSLTHLPHLEALDLRSVDLTDVDLQVLAGSSLVRLNVGAQDLEDKLSQLRERLPKLDTSASKPLSILAGLCDESKFGMYDVLSNRMEIEW
ncbi:MAG: hypothetical protein JSS49_29440 [Planctomycetes bacterium]|nr:hypothetical protein [Planctomycetota bacterium]